MMPWPGIVISGLIRPSSVGPQLEKLAICSAPVAAARRAHRSALFAVEGCPPIPAPARVAGREHDEESGCSR
jgi:hypothetical protein